MYWNNTPLEIYLTILFGLAAFATVLALWALTSIVVEELHHRREAQARARQAGRSPYRPVQPRTNTARSCTNRGASHAVDAVRDRAP